MFDPIPDRDEQIAYSIIGAAIEVHRILGPGFLESVYQEALLHELALRGFKVERELSLRIPYTDIVIANQRVDLLVENRIIVELKCVEDIAPIHEAILLSYLKTTKLRLGLLLNFNTPILKDRGIRRVVL
ncbi:MAG: GxxExxY protein [Pirellulales bacterium]|nr:GxxExxY protein [Pirellulales bacterium]